MELWSYGEQLRAVMKLWSYEERRAVKSSDEVMELWSYEEQ